MLTIKNPSEGEFEMVWYSNKRGDKVVKEFHRGYTGPIKIGPENLVHVFPALNGAKLTKGKVPAAALKAMAAVVRAGKDAEANGQCSCAACEEERTSDGYVSCERCGFMFHVECAEPEAEVGQEDWWCQSCMEST